MDGRDPQAAMITETETDLVVWDDTARRYRGRLGASTDTLDPNSHDASFSALDYRGMLGRRIIWPGSTVAFSNVDQVDIGWQLIADTQNLPGGGWGIRRNAPRTGVLRTRTLAVGDNLGQDLTDLGDLDNGFEWEIDAALNFNTFYPQRGNNLGKELVYGDNVSGATRTLDTSSFANAVRWSGADGVAAQTAVVGSFGAPGRWELQVGDTSITDTTTLAAKAAWELANDARFVPSYTLTLTRGWWTPEIIWLGDTVEAVVKSGRLDVDVVERVSQISVTVGDEADEETVQVTVGPIPTSLPLRLAQYKKRLTGLELR